MESAEAQASGRTLRLLWEADQRFGLKEWPVRRRRRFGAAAALAGGRTSTQDAGEGPRASSTGMTMAKTSEQVSAPKADAEHDKALAAVMEAFPPQLDEPPGADPRNRPDPMFSARYTLKGSAVERVKEKVEALAKQAEQVKACRQCGLYKLSTQSVFGIGHPDTRIVFVGEGPGAEEDKTGFPFVGRAGQLLTAMIEKGMGLRREHVYICNVVKHRPPDNRTPTTDETAACQEHLWRQLSVLEPEIVVALGAPATQTLLNTKGSLGRVRGQAFELNLAGPDAAGGTIAKCVPTYHPAYLLRNPADKRKTWEDLQKIMTLMGIPNR